MNALPRPRAILLAATALSFTVSTEVPAQRLFRSDTVLTVTISTDLRSLLRERDSTKLKEHAGVLTYTDSGGVTRVPVTLQARGHFRRQQRNCAFPPLYLNFKTDSVKKTLLGGLKKLKITTNCRPGNNEYEQYVLQEYLIFRAYSVFTDFGPRTRLARITYRDTTGKEQPVTSWAFFIEDMGDLGERMKRQEFKANQALFDDLEQEPLRLISVFEYFVGGLDWSVSARHNIVLFRDSTAQKITPVAYDWDFTGAVDARYASVDPRLRVRRVTDRLYRGVCMTPDQFKETIDLFRAKRAPVDSLFAQVPQLSPDRVKRMQNFFSDFWKRTDDPRSLQRDFAADCQKVGN